jgi:hypothetical protein
MINLSIEVNVSESLGFEGLRYEAPSDLLPVGAPPTVSDIIGSGLETLEKYGEKSQECGPARR